MLYCISNCSIKVSTCAERHVGDVDASCCLLFQLSETGLKWPKIENHVPKESNSISGKDTGKSKLHDEIHSAVKQIQSLRPGKR